MPPAQEYDLVLLNGRVIDPETMFDGITNVGIIGDTISIVTTDPISGKETIDATGLAIAPGFIDTHHHWMDPVGYKLAARDGRTTVMDLEYGVAGNVAKVWYEGMEGKCEINYGKGSSHEGARSVVLDGAELSTGETKEALAGRSKKGWCSTKATLEQGNEIMKVLDEGLQYGCPAVSSTLGYMRDAVSAREVFEFQKLGAAYGRPAAMHFRGTPGTEAMEVNGIQELLANAAALRAPAIACHFNNAGYNLVHELLARMRDTGMNVWGELYPYNAGSTTIGALFLRPENWKIKLGYKYEETMQDALTGKFYTEQEYLQMRDKEPTRLIILYKIPEECIKEWMAFPEVAVGSDSMPIYADGLTWDTPFEEMPNGHPRAAGCCAKVLRLGREMKLPLLHSVNMLSFVAAKRLGMCGLKQMQKRGRVQEGMIADLTLFNPETVTDKSTYAQGCLPSEGIPYVLVSGQFVVKDGLNTTNKPGKGIKYDPTPSRREPLSLTGWKRAWTATAKLDFGGTDHKQEHICC